MISKEQMENIVNLSKLYLSEEELEQSMKEVGSIIDFVNQINKIENVDIEFEGISSISNALRDDKVTESSPREEILSNVGGGKDGFFYLEKFV